MLFAPEVIEAVRVGVRIADLANRNCSLRRVGQRLTGLCPFHPEKHPSFSIHLERNCFHCFGCEAKGDVIDFIQRDQNLNFRDAVAFGARQIGLSLDGKFDKEFRRKISIEQVRRARQREIEKFVESERDLLDNAFRVFCRLATLAEDRLREHIFDSEDISDEPVDVCWAILANLRECEWSFYSRAGMAGKGFALTSEYERPALADRGEIESRYRAGT